MSVDEVRDAMIQDKFRFGCTPLLVKFFMVNGIIKEDDKDYIKLKSLLHSQLPQGQFCVGHIESTLVVE